MQNCNFNKKCNTSLRVFYEGNLRSYGNRHIEGYCNQVPKGHIRVGFWIGKCGNYSLGNGATGWNSMSRIVIKEVPPPQS